jgi:hypothetical protein
VYRQFGSVSLLSGFHDVLTLRLTIIARSGMGHQLDADYMALASELSSVLESAEAALEPDSQNPWSHLNPDSLYFTHILTNVVVPLLELSGPSQEIVKYLEDLSRVIGLLCYCIKGRGFEQKAEEVRLAVRRYLSVRIIYDPHSAFWQSLDIQTNF